MGQSRAHRGSFVAIASLLLLSAHSADGGERDIEALKKQMEELIRINQAQQKRIEALEQKLDSLDAAASPKRAEPSPAAVVRSEPSQTPGSSDAAANAALDEAVKATEQTSTPSASTDVWSRQVGASKLRLIDISFDTLVAAGTSTAPNSMIENLQGGAHDPNRRGFTLQQAELSFAGAVDPYFNAEAHAVFTTDEVELEEAFMTTQALPYGLQLEAGHFLTEYGLINPVHPHAWDWLDQPFLNTRLMGPEGTRAPGVRLGWLMPIPWFSELNFGIQNADEDETTPSFLSDEAVGGRPTTDRSVRDLGDLLYLARWNNSWNLTDEWTALIGVSGLHGPNATGDDGDTWIYGADLKVRWRPRNNFRGWPFLIWQTEFSKRDYHADAFVAPDDTGVSVPSAILRDAGFYTQALYGFRPGWAGGVRFEYASGSGQSLIDGQLVSRQDDPTRADRFRASPLLVWQPTEYSRFRLQYNYDDAAFIHGGDAHTFWVGAEVLYGAHPAHKY